jgi:acyl carrier protein
MSLPETSKIRSEARAIVSEMCRAEMGDQDAIISAGRIDSLSILKLISRLEQRLGVTIPPDTLQPDDFDSVDLIVETVERVAQPR